MPEEIYSLSAGTAPPPYHEGWDYIVFGDKEDPYSGKATPGFHNTYEQCRQEMDAYIQTNGGAAWCIRWTLLMPAGQPVSTQKAAVMAQSKECPIKGMHRWRNAG